jgi:hypothetical protein
MSIEAVAAETAAPGRGGSDVLSALNWLGGGSAQGVVGSDDHEGEDALRDDVHDRVGHNLECVRRSGDDACQEKQEQIPCASRACGGA